jgi:hypothetical protein
MMKYKTHYYIGNSKFLCGTYFLQANCQDDISKITCQRCKKIFDNVHKVE